MQTTTTSTGKAIHWPSAIQLGLSLLAFSMLITSGLGLGAAGMIQYFTEPGQEAEGLSLLLRSAGLVLPALLVLPSALFALLRLLKPEERPAAGRFQLRLPWGLIILLFPLVLWLGNQVVGQRFVAPFLLPLLHLLAIGLPVGWLLFLALRKLPLGSPQRAWGVFATGLVLSPALIIVLELVALAVVVVAAVVIISLQPGVADELQALARQLQGGGQNPEALLEELAPFLSQPLVIYGALVYVAGIVPLIEEALKPLGVWLLAGRNLSPAAGFAAGALSGAGYALFESLALATGGGEEWAFQAFIRSGTGIIHIVTSGLTGYALALAWREARFIRLGVAYLLSVTLHGLWNGLTVLFGFGSLLNEIGAGNLPLLERVVPAFPFAVGYLALTGFVLLLLGNRLLRRQAPAPESVPAPESPA